MQKGGGGGNFGNDKGGELSSFIKKAGDLENALSTKHDQLCKNLRLLAMEGLGFGGKRSWLCFAKPRWKGTGQGDQDGRSWNGKGGFKPLWVR